MRAINLIIVHHSASPLTTTASQIAEWHKARFSGGIGYHRVIEADGRVLDGRPLQAVGAHARGSNRNSIGICVVGDNTRLGIEWTALQEFALIETLRYFCNIYEDAKVCGHRDTPGASTECPGLDIRQWCIKRDVRVPLLSDEGEKR